MEAAGAGAGRNSESRSSERVARNTGKRARKELQLFSFPEIKDEEDETEAAKGTPPGAGPVVPSESPPSPAAAESILVGKAMLRCSLCSRTLKKPIYQCAAGHLACCGCRVKLPDNACPTCLAGGGAAAALSHSPGLDAFFGKVQVPCPFAQYGCRSFVPYFTSADHRAACAHAPCFCPEPGCGLVCGPQALPAHLAHAHDWPAAAEVAYSTPLQLAVPVPHRRLLRGDDASLFLVAAAELGIGDGAAVSVVHVRASRPAHPRFTCTFYANAPPEAAELQGGYFFATLPVRTTALADGDGVAPDKGLYFAVPGEMLRRGDGEEGRELLLSVRIDRSFGPDTRGQDDR